MKSEGRYNVGLLILRIALGLTILYFGSQKLFGLFGGPGYNGSIGFFTQMGIPTPFGQLAMVAEFFGGLGVLFGLLSRLAAFGIACTMAVATFMTAKGPGLLNDIFVKGHGAQELFLPVCLFFLAISILVMGSGTYSLEAKLIKKGKR